MNGVDGMSKCLDIIIVAVLGLIVGLLVFFDGSEIEDTFIFQQPSTTIHNTNK